MKKRMTMFVLALTLIAISASALAQWATVNNPDPAERLNLRAKPSAQAISYGKYYNGTQVQILSGPNRGWYHVRVGLGNGISEVEGYMMAKYLAVGEKAAQVKDVRPVVTIGGAKDEYVYLVDFHTGSKVGKMRDGEKATVLGVGSEYLHVVTADGDTGMVEAELAAPRLYFSAQKE